MIGGIYDRPKSSKHVKKIISFDLQMNDDMATDKKGGVRGKQNLAYRQLLPSACNGLFAIHPCTPIVPDL